MDPVIVSTVSRLTEDTPAPSAEAALIVVKVDNEYVENDWERWEAIILDIRAIVDREGPETVRMSVAGGLNSEMERASQDTLSKLLPISMVIIVIILYLSLRRISDVILAVVAVPLIFIWTFGISVLLGLGFTQFTFAAPILVLSLGIDYGIHSLHRYREELRNGATPGEGVELSITHVGAALFLTTATTVGAFLSNVVSEVPAIRDFGITVALGIMSAFVMMGIFLPALRLVVDRNFPGKEDGGVGDPGKEKTVNENSGKEIAGKEIAGKEMSVKEIRPPGPKSDRPIFVLMADAALDKPLVVLLIVALITLGSVTGALQLATETPIRDLTAEDSEFVTSLDLLDEKFPSVGGENGYILLKGDIANPATIAAMGQTIAAMDDDGKIALIDGRAKSESVFPYLMGLMANETLLTSLGIADINNDSIPDTAAGLVIAFDYLYDYGIDISEQVEGDGFGGNYIAPRKVRAVLHRFTDEPGNGSGSGSGAGSSGSGGKYDMALLIVEARDVEGAEGKYLLEELEEDAAPLREAGLEVIVTGSPVTRHEMLEAMTDGMMKSIFLSITISSIFLIAVFRSVKDGLITILPVILISTWVFGTMFLFGYSINVVTVTIAAMTIGVGVDYSIHIRQRYREELGETGSPTMAIDTAIEHSGRALFGAAATTSLGFGVLYFSEMTIFSMFGVLSALMIVYAFIGAIVVLPGLLLAGDGHKL